jgi:putative peptide zinc metalloprotease protein
MDLALPGLRQELRIEPGAPLVTGAPSWTLFDPIRHVFYQLGRIEYRILSHWANGTLGTLNDDLTAEGLEADEAKAAISQVIEFSLTNSLTVAPIAETVATLNRQRETARREWWKWLVDHYLFIRIPLVRPAAFLERTQHIVAPLWSRTSLTIFAMLAMLGFVLVSRQWDAFKASFLYFFNLQGLAAYFVALGFVKIIHELGHAYTATRFGARVPAMGISVLVMMPVLYTDTTAAWRLKSRRQRMLIDIAGVTAELMVATLATLLWVALPDGSLRSACFVLATTSWVMSIAINISPFMRYDGYYLLSDLIGVPNLQNRSFAIARWQLREWLFGFGDPAPEEMPQRLRTGLTWFAFVTWLYRLVLFLGIALLVYHLFFKLLGVILFAVEMVVFILRPIANEMATWWGARSRIAASPRGRRWGWVVGILLLLALLPLDRHVSAPAILTPIGAAPVVAGDPAQIDRVLAHNGQIVTAGTPLMILSAPELERDAALHRVNIARASEQLDRGMADKRDLSNRSVIESELIAERAALESVENRRQRLILRASIAGRVTGIEPDMQPGRWLGGNEVVARILTPGRYDVQAFADETDIDRIAPDARARFVPDDATLASRPTRLVERGASALSLFDQPLLASTHGGPIAVAETSDKQMKPRRELYRLRLVAARDDGTAAILQPVAGIVKIDAAGRSFAGRVFAYVARVLRGEASLSG